MVKEESLGIRGQNNKRFPENRGDKKNRDENKERITVCQPAVKIDSCHTIHAHTPFDLAEALIFILPSL
jgi:hypothetical protein